MQQFEISPAVIVNVAAAELWWIIGYDLSRVGEWSEAVSHSVGIGYEKFDGAVWDTRTWDACAKGFSNLNERITEYNYGNRTPAFDVHEEMPGFVAHINSRHVISDSDDGISKDEL